MLVISNNVKHIGMSFPPEATIRINVAWISSTEELCKIIEENQGHDIWVDYPTGRTKPPVPVLSIAEAIAVASVYPQVKYFAFSNAEDKNIVQLIRQAVPRNIKLVPKIETADGIKNLEEIVKASQTDTIMFDREDLYTDLLNSSKQLTNWTKTLYESCKKLNIKVLSLKGVIFSE